MTDRKTLKESFKTVGQNSSDELEKRLRIHRRKKFLAVLWVCVVLVLFVIGFWMYETYRTYTSYEIVSAEDREDTYASGFEPFSSGFLKYTKDGVVLTGSARELVLSQGYEMDDPKVAVRDGYAAVYDRGGTEIYIINKETILSNIKVTIPIHTVSVAANGSVAVLMEKGDTGYIQIYDKFAEQIAGGELHVQNTGYPVNLALSPNGECMAVSILDINEGKLKTILAFYNFGSAGADAIDKIVGSYSYSDIIIPSLKYTDDGQLLAFADDRVIMFSSQNRPGEDWTVRLTDEVRSVSVGKDMFALTFDRVTDETEYITEVYDFKGKKVSEIPFAMDYREISFLDNGEISIESPDSLEIYLSSGRKRVSLTFEDELYCVVADKKPGRYTFITEGKTIKAKLK
ncbi:MAG: DUF5711 family protein [Lachnospiraceae bacterium]|nr:DUF5711 family protein [Lachnospiraceae bacterium]